MEAQATLLDLLQFSSLVTNLIHIKEIWEDQVEEPLPSSSDEGPENGVQQHLCRVKKNTACCGGEVCLHRREEKLTTIDFIEGDCHYKILCRI